MHKKREHPINLYPQNVQEEKIANRLEIMSSCLGTSLRCRNLKNKKNGTFLSASVVNILNF